MYAGRLSIESPARGMNWALETEENIEKQKEGGRQIDREHQNGGWLKKFQGDDGRDFHASEHRHQNDQPIPALPEPGGSLGGGDFSFLGIHTLSSL